MELRVYFSHIIQIHNVIYFLILTVLCTPSYSQDSIFNNINKSFEESIKSNEEICGYWCG